MYCVKWPEIIFYVLENHLSMTNFQEVIALNIISLFGKDLVEVFLDCRSVMKMLFAFANLMIEVFGFLTRIPSVNQVVRIKHA